ncbi:hypothetical protein JTE90_014950 [Oedothorax gibbosus]|uniref:Uncharacterized protein n=1 Tax=Oedothorax gibbosus TaxID=931172 RepID=A0AAV6UZ09_9ARAC|nr:hypothetical protein JTE90_014950 [Oedothorax gibbosus]
MSRAVAFFKRGLHEEPHLVYGAGFTVACWIGMYFAWRRNNKYDIHRRAWKRRYTVVREEDFDPSKQVHRIERRYPWF